MKIKTLPLLALGAFALALSSERPLPAVAGAASHACGPQISGTTRGSAPAWAVVRVTVARDGTVEGEHVVFHSGNRAFDDAAMLAVANSGFTPSPSSPESSTSSFDYLLMSACDGVRSSRILDRLAPHVGIVKAEFSVAPREDAWKSSNP